MPTIPVRFRYVTGLVRPLFRNVRLMGSWNAEGQYSAAWSTTDMKQTTGEDGCPTFVATVNFDAAQTGWVYQWGIMLDVVDRAQNIWGIMTEVRDVNSTARERLLPTQAGRGR